MYHAVRHQFGLYNLQYSHCCRSLLLNLLTNEDRMVEDQMCLLLVYSEVLSKYCAVRIMQ